MEFKDAKASLTVTGEAFRFTEEIQEPASCSRNVYMQVNPIESPCPSQQKNPYFDLVSPVISAMNTPTANFEHSAAKEVSYLHPPKARTRITSTPNVPGLSCTPDLSPTGANSIYGLPKVKSRLHKKPMVNDPKGVLYPQQKSHTGQATKDDSIQTLTKMNLNKEPNVDFSHFHMSQDSGFDSLGASACSHESINSPIKRKAGGDITSVESPMKRLAFVTSQIKTSDASDFETTASYDASRPGSSFFCDRDEGIGFLETPPTPIFANTIQFTPSRSLKPIFTDEDFAFSKPTAIPRRPQNLRPNPSMQHISNFDFDTSCHVGKKYFDIISHLARRDLSHVITNIFRTIRPKDIFRSSHVSTSWAAICRKNSFLKCKIKTFKKQYHDDELKYGSENGRVSDAIKNALLKTPAKNKPGRDFSTGVSTLGQLQRRAKRTPTKAAIFLLPTTPSGKNHYVPAENKYQHNQAVKRTLVFGETLRPCPKCGWTAKIYGDGSHKGLCYRYKCRFAFCTLCKSPYHFPEKCSPLKLSPPSKSDGLKEPKIGSKKSRERLKKRLLM